MAPSHVTPPIEYSPTYCADVHKICSEKMDEALQVAYSTRDDLKKKLSLKTIKGVLVVLGMPTILACLALYAFYIQAPLTYAEKEELNALNTKIVVMETKLGAIPNKDEVRDIMTDVVKKHMKP